MEKQFHKVYKNIETRPDDTKVVQLVDAVSEEVIIESRPFTDAADADDLWETAQLQLATSLVKTGKGKVLKITKDFIEFELLNEESVQEGDIAVQVVIMPNEANDKFGVGVVVDKKIVCEPTEWFDEEYAAYKWYTKNKASVEKLIIAAGYKNLKLLGPHKTSLKLKEIQKKTDAALKRSNMPKYSRPGLNPSLN